MYLLSARIGPSFVRTFPTIRACSGGRHGRRGCWRHMGYCRHSDNTAIRRGAKSHSSMTARRLGRPGRHAHQRPSGPIFQPLANASRLFSGSPGCWTSGWTVPAVGEQLGAATPGSFAISRPTGHSRADATTADCLERRAPMHSDFHMHRGVFDTILCDS